jgi:hypothetical protein
VGSALEEHADQLLDVGHQAPVVTVECARGRATTDHEIVEPERVRFGLAGGSSFVVDREPAAIRMRLHEPPAPGAVLHPLLTAPISVLARWRGDITLHAGGFELDGRAWGLVGPRGAGKSTTLALLAGSGCRLVADDLLALSDGHAWSGPGCVDLRADAAERFPAARYVGASGERCRHRLSAPSASARPAFGGIVVLRWGDGPEVESRRLELKEHLALLYEQEYAGLLGPGDPRKILDLLAYPAWEVRRPRDWSASESLVRELLTLTAAG